MKKDKELCFYCILIINIGYIFWEKHYSFKSLKFFGASIFEKNDKLYFIGGKVGTGDNEEDFKKEIYSFTFEGTKFFETDFQNEPKFYFIESKLHYFNNEMIGNFLNFGEGNLMTIETASLFFSFIKAYFIKKCHFVI